MSTYTVRTSLQSKSKDRIDVAAERSFKRRIDLACVASFLIGRLGALVRGRGVVSSTRIAEAVELAVAEGLNAWKHDRQDVLHRKRKVKNAS